MTTSMNVTGASQQLQVLASTASGTQSSSSSDNNSTSWYEAMAKAWGQTLDNEANRISTMSDSLSQGADSPSQITDLTAEAMRMGFMSNSSSSSLDSVGKALETMARKG